MHWVRVKKIGVLLLWLSEAGWGAESAETLLRYLVEDSMIYLCQHCTDTCCVIRGRSVAGYVGAREKT